MRFENEVELNIFHKTNVRKKEVNLPCYSDRVTKKKKQIKAITTSKQVLYSGSYHMTSGIAEV